MADEIDTIRELRKGLERRIDIRPLVASIIEEYDGLEELGKEVTRLQRTAKNEQNRVRLMIEILKIINVTSEPEDDDLPDDIEALEAEAKALLQADD